MAKKDDKRLGEDPFERFLPQIQDSRKKKIAISTMMLIKTVTALQTKTLTKTTALMLL